MTQDSALQILKTGANVFLTGEPGSGKTHTINQYVNYLRSCGIEPAITASTGIAATHIGGMTIHSWSGIGIRNELTSRDLDTLCQNERLVKRIVATQILIIDEISMLSAQTLNMIERVCRAIRNPGQPFGGLQVVLVGDFFQLPPVFKRANQNFNNQTVIDGGQDLASLFAYRSSAWAALKPVVCYLTEQHRQADKVFAGVLSALRSGDLDDEHMALLDNCRKAGGSVEQCTRLFPHNADVDRLNDIELNKLQTETRIFEMSGRGKPVLIETLKRNCLSPDILRLKVGARVMFTKNSMEDGFFNGTTGTVTGFSKTSGQPEIKITSGRTIEVEPAEWAIEDSGKVLARVMQLPLRLAWAITVHKSQGMSLDSAVIDLSQAFEYGQGYVALSRLRTLAGLQLLGFNQRALEVHPDVREIDGEFRGQSDAAEEAIDQMTNDECATLQENFITARGGKIGRGRAKPKSAKRGDTYNVTKEMILKKLSLAAIVQERGLVIGTIVGHVETLLESGQLDLARDVARLIAEVIPDTDRMERIKFILEKVNQRDGQMKLSPVREMLGDSFSFEEIRLVRLLVSSESSNANDQ
jgi:hypothetical protein